MTCDAVVVAVCACIAAGERDGFTCGHVFIAEHASGSHCHHVTHNQASFHHAGHRHGRGCGVVVHLVSHGDAADGQRLGCDVGAAAGLVGDGVVAHVSTASGAGERHRFASTHVFTRACHAAYVVKHACGGDGHHITTHQTGEQGIGVGHGGGCTSVVHTAVSHQT